MIDSKEEVILSSLNLFAQDGYDAVTFGQIADALGVTAAALSRYVINKAELFRQSISLIDRRYTQSVRPLALTASMDSSVRAESLIRFSMDLFTFWTTDDFAVPFRRALTIAQFEDEQMHQLLLQYLVSTPIKTILEAFTALRIADADAQAAQFYGTIFLFYELYDGAAEKDRVLQQFQQQVTLLAKEILTSYD